MKIIVFFTLLLFSSLSFSLPPSNANNVRLEQSCPLGDDHCFTSLSTLAGWMNSRPNKTISLHIDIGAGHYDVGNQRFCDGVSNLSVMGSGVGATVLTGDILEIEDIYRTSLSFFDCDNVTMNNLSVKAQNVHNSSTGGSEVAVVWNGSTNGKERSTWSNVNIEGATVGWYDENGLHYFFGSTVSSVTNLANPGGIFEGFGGVAFYGDGESWFYGGEITMVHNEASLVQEVYGVYTYDGDIRIFGSAVRVMSAPGAGKANFMAGFNILQQGPTGDKNQQIHMHGGIVNVSGSNGPADQNVYGMNIFGGNFQNNSLIHTPGTAFVLKAGANGTATRIRVLGNQNNNSSAKILSPFLWESGTTPPNIVSQNGSDLFVETDCATTSCSHTGTETHLLIYNDTCTADGPWFDVVTGRCRGETDF